MSWITINEPSTDIVQIITFHIYATTKQIGDKFPVSQYVNSTNVDNIDADIDFIFTYIEHDDGRTDFEYFTFDETYEPLLSQQLANLFKTSNVYKQVSRYYNRRNAYENTNIEVKRLLFTLASKIYGEDKTDTELVALVSTDIDNRLDLNLSN